MRRERPAPLGMLRVQERTDRGREGRGGKEGEGGGGRGGGGREGRREGGREGGGERGGEREEERGLFSVSVLCFSLVVGTLLWALVCGRSSPPAVIGCDWQ